MVKWIMRGLVVVMLIFIAYSMLKKSMHRERAAACLTRGPPALLSRSLRALMRRAV